MSAESATTPDAKSTPRVDSVDLLRGFVMVLMVLDHVRDFFGNTQFNVTDPATTTIPLFFPRWITHFSVPTLTDRSRPRPITGIHCSSYRECGS